MKEYIDLGLPSGTRWASESEEGYYTYNEAVEKFRDNLPTLKQCGELIDECEWEWDSINMRYTVTGPNGNSIFLPTTGYRDRDENTYNVDSEGYYWSSTPNSSFTAWYLDFNLKGVYTDYDNRYCIISVRLVKKINKK